MMSSYCIKEKSYPNKIDETEERQITEKPLSRPKIGKSRIFELALKDTKSSQLGKGGPGKRNVTDAPPLAQTVIQTTVSLSKERLSSEKPVPKRTPTQPRYIERYIEPLRKQPQRNLSNSATRQLQSTSQEEFILKKRNILSYSMENASATSPSKLSIKEKFQALGNVEGNGCGRQESNVSLSSRETRNNTDTDSSSWCSISSSVSEIGPKVNEIERCKAKKFDNPTCTAELEEDHKAFAPNRKVISSNSLDPKTGKSMITIVRNFDEDNVLSETLPENFPNEFVNFSVTKSVSENHNAITDDLLDCLPHKYPNDQNGLFADIERPFIPPPQPVRVAPDATEAQSEIQSARTSGYSSFNETPISELSLLSSSPVQHELQIEKITEYLKSIEANKSMSIDITHKCLADIRRVVNYYSKGNLLLLYGSFLCGLAVSTSNVNVALKAEHTPSNQFLLHLQKNMARDLTHYQVEPLEEDPNPKKSKICFTEPEHGVSCEIVYLGKSVTSFRRTNHLLKSVCEYDMRIKSLIIATRIWAEVCALHEPENGKLHSLSFALLVIHFLQRLENPLLPVIDVEASNLGLTPLPVKNNAPLGRLWLDFQKYYSDVFNWKDSVVSILSRGTISKKSMSWDRSWIAIEDPCSKKNVADTVVDVECAECIFSCFKATFLYFSSSPTHNRENNSLECEQSSGKNDSSVQWNYNFSNIAFEQNLCEDCDDQDSDCERCEVKTEHAALPPLTKLSEASMKCVNDVLHEVYKEFVLADSRVNGRKAFVRDLQLYIQKKFIGAKLTLFGSSVNSFGFRNSDIDICMTFNKVSRKCYSDSAVLNILRQLTYHLRKDSRYKDVIGLYGATIPIVKFVFEPEGWNCDISFYNVLGVQNSKLLSKYALIDERCRILGCALKLLAKKTCLADCSLKSLSSYSYLLMVIHYLQQVEPPVLPILEVEPKEAFEELDVSDELLMDRNEWFCGQPHQLRMKFLARQDKNQSSVGALWLGMLEFYLKYEYRQAITITQKEPMMATSLPRLARLYNISDPFIDKNLGCIVSQRKAEQTIRIFSRARILFGREIPKEHLQNPKGYYFSSSNLTGQILKEVECIACGN